MALLNELLEEAAARSVELADRAGDATRVVSALAEASEELSERLGTEGDQAHARLREAGEDVEEAGHAAQAAGDQARDGFDRLSRRAGDLRVRTERLLAQVQEAAAGIESRREQTAAALQAHVDEGSADLEALRQEAEPLRVRLLEHAQDAAGRLGALRQSMDETRAAVQGSRQRLMAAFDALEAQARQETESWLLAADQAIHRIGPRLLDGGDRVLEAHNQAVAEVRSRLCDQAAQEANDAVVPLEAAVAEVYQLCSALDLALEEEAAGVRARVEAALATMARLRPVLESASRLG